MKQLRLNAEIEQIVTRERVLRDEIAKIIVEIEGCRMKDFNFLIYKTEEEDISVSAIINDDTGKINFKRAYQKCI